ncbi:MAG: DUF6029 family protein [Bacteroidia bacterium]
MKKKKLPTYLFYLLIAGGIWFSNPVFAQVGDIGSQIHGNFQVDAQYYSEDTAIGAPIVPEKVLSNGFGNLNYQNGNFSAGLRYESYQKVMQGFDNRYKGQGIPYRYARYKHKDIDFTVGNFYEQFGSGLIFRSYEERGLLYDNAMDGMRVIFNPYQGITLKGLIGKQRTFFSLSPGIVRGFDAEININELFDSLSTKKTKVILGGSFVSKYQEDKDPALIIPENVGCYGGRINIIRGGFNFFGEGAYKINDPSLVNNGSYKDGRAAYVTTSYSTKGFSMSLAGKIIDNMSFRSDRDASGSVDMINFLPALTKPHTYLLMAFYPYATQPNGEMGLQAEVQYKFKKGSPLGGKYGMDIAANFSSAYCTDTTNLGYQQDSARLYKYKINYMNTGQLYFYDANIEISKKFSKKFKGTLMLSHQFYNDNIIRHSNAFAGYPNIKSFIGVVDLTYKYKSTSAIRMELQSLRTASDTMDKGSWAAGLLEWTPNSHFFVAVIDQYNYGNRDENKRYHYFLGTVGYINGPTRVTLEYGKKRAGIFCVGGVCRNVPASNGVTITISTSF